MRTKDRFVKRYPTCSSPRARATTALRRLLLFTATMLWSGCSPNQGPSDPSSPLPNIVVLIADDLGWGDVGFNGSEIETPNIDSLAATGVVLERFYAFPTCSASRFALLSGQYPRPPSILYEPLRPWSTDGIPADVELLPERLKRGGYRTALVGKWHLGHSRREQWPTAHGFDHFFGFLTGAIDYFSHEAFGARDWQRNGKSVDQRGYSTVLLGTEAVRTIRTREESRPLFLCVSFNAPHYPAQAQQHLIQKYQDSLERPRTKYAAVVDALDNAIGRILGAIEDESIAENTVVLFLSDNGARVRAGGSNGPFAEGKQSVREGGLRVPAVLRCPALGPGGNRISQVTSVLDICPTLLELADLEFNPQDFDGRSILPELRRESLPSECTLFFAARQDRDDEVLNFAVLDGDWKLYTEQTPDLQQLNLALYNLEADPFESQNVAVDQAEVVGRLQKALEEWTLLHPCPPLDDLAAPPKGWRPPRDWATPR